ncbi:hypothetical protein NDU88_004650 [Pleurodeles waltl]|uniref:Uncharacterized protein n=1 Tax=Pleurodeles waltl TaxID=8319 RepID=A0AAV7V1U1_PLEWA|nr:hypothetical protein NDU88_004650 [Pleurodeles waltl]
MPGNISAGRRHSRERGGFLDGGSFNHRCSCAAATAAVTREGEAVPGRVPRDGSSFDSLVPVWATAAVTPKYLRDPGNAQWNLELLLSVTEIRIKGPDKQTCSTRKVLHTITK